MSASISHSTLVLASHNAGKLREFQSLFSTIHLPVQVRPQSDFNVSDAIENGLSFVENAIIKARHAARLTGHATIADDSGLVIPILQGAPGIYSARYAGQHGNDNANNQKLLEQLQNHRSNTPIVGQFVCVLALVRHADDPLPIIAQGVWQGEILESPRGTHGFGYDPLFWMPDLQCSSAELDPATKNQISHRAQALRSLVQQVQAF